MSTSKPSSNSSSSSTSERSISMSMASSSYWSSYRGVYLCKSEFEVGEAVGGREVVVDQGQGAGRVGFGNEKEVGCEGGPDGMWEWEEAVSVSAEQKFMSLRAKRALGDGSGEDRSVRRVISIKEK